MRSGNISIRTGSIDELTDLLGMIPEFEAPLTRKEITDRLQGKRCVILVATMEAETAGFKAGYVDGDLFYSWIGGVHPAHRRKGVATLLADEQESRVREMGLKRIRFKTRDRFRAMMSFAQKRGFQIQGTTQSERDGGSMILLEKKL